MNVILVKVIFINIIVFNEDLSFFVFVHFMEMKFAKINVREYSILTVCGVFVSAYELWFKQILYEVDSVRELFMNTVRYHQWRT